MVLNRFDTAPAIAVEQWKKYLVADGGLRADNRGGNVPVFCVDSKRGRGVHEVHMMCVLFSTVLSCSVAGQMHRSLNRLYALDLVTTKINMRFSNDQSWIMTNSCDVCVRTLGQLVSASPV